MEVVKVELSNTDLELRIPAADFSRIRESAGRMEKRTLDAASEMLVDGRKLTDVANAYGLTKQRALAIRDQVYAKYLRLTPEGWDAAMISAPREMLNRFIEEAESARLEYFKTRQFSKG